MPEYVIAYDHSQPEQGPQRIPKRWIGAPFAKQWSTTKPRVDLGVDSKKPATKATDKKE